jgi:NADH-quinone oxidoreductase subunit C
VDATALAERLRPAYPDAVLARDEVTIVVDRERLSEVLRELRDDPDLAFDALSDLSCTDWPGREPRIWMAYHLYSLGHHHRVRVKVGLLGDDLTVPSVVPLFPTADWHEREVYDFFGVIFDGHPDLRRIELPEGWQGHPLRKDHPLGGVITRYKQGAVILPPDQRGL